MKLIKEYINKVIIWVIICAILMELGIFAVMYIKSRQIFFKVYQDTIIKSEINRFKINM